MTNEEIYAVVRRARAALTTLEVEATDPVPDLIAVQNAATIACEAACRIVVAVEEREADAATFVRLVRHARGDATGLAQFAPRMGDALC